jgi:SnoaL-like domain
MPTRFDGAGTFAGDALLAYWDGTGEETAPRTLAHGSDEIRAALPRGAFAGGRPEILVQLDDGSNCLLEGRLTGESDGPSETFAASLQRDRTGAITRCLLYRTPLVEPSRTWDGENAPSPGDARTVLDAYFEYLGHGRFEEAADCFSEDCLYSHPPYAPGAGRAEFRGRAELLAGFVRRGYKSYDYRFAVVLQRGSDCIVEGTASGTTLGGSFLSSLSLDADGRIHRYAAFYCEPSVPRR